MADLLIVDDEAQILEGIRTGIPWEAHGVEVVGTAGSAAEALTVIESRLPEIVILDVKMPDMDGLELLEIVRERYPSIKVILISGHDDFSYAQKAVGLGAFDYLLKPLDGAKLLSKVLEAKGIAESEQAAVIQDLELRHRFRESLPVLQDAFFTRLLRGRPMDAAAMYARAEALEIRLDGPFFAAVVLQVESPDEGADRDFLLFAAREAAERTLREGHPCTHAFLLDDRIGLVVSGPLRKEALMASVRRLRDWANASLGAMLSAGIGRIRRGIEGMPLSLQEALEALEFRMVQGRNELIDAECLQEEARVPVAGPAFEAVLRASEDEMRSALQAGDAARIRALADGILESLRAHAESDVKRRDGLLFSLASFLTRVAAVLDLPEGAGCTDGGAVHASLRACAGIEEIRVRLDACLADLEAGWRERQRKANSFLVRRALECVRECPYGEASLARVAQKLRVHPNYLSRIVRQETGMPFTEHVIGRKMEEARRLLKTTTRRVHEIAEQLHYRDVNHFTKVFKKAVGVSPTEYREL